MGKLILISILKKKIIKTQFEFTDHMMTNESLVKLPYPFKKIRPLKPRYTKLDIDLFIDFCIDLGFKSFLNNIEEWKTYFTLKRKGNAKKKLKIKTTNT